MSVLMCVSLLSMMVAAFSIDEDLRRLNKIDRELDSIQERRLIQRNSRKNAPLETRHYREGTLDGLRMDLSQDKEYVGMNFMRTNVFKEKKRTRQASEIIMLHTRRSVELYDLSGALLFKLDLGNQM